MKGVSLIDDGDGTERASHAMCVCRIRTVYPSVDADTNTCIVLVTGTAAVRLAFPFGQRLGCRGKPGRAGANGGGGVRKFGCGAAMPRAGPARSGARERVPRRQERGVGSASESAKKAKKAERRSGCVEDEPDVWGPTSAGWRAVATRWAL